MQRQQPPQPFGVRIFQRSLKALTDIGKNYKSEHVNKGQDENETIDKRCLKALTDIGKNSKAEHVNTGQEENETVDKKSLKGFTDIDKNSKAEYVNKGQDEKETIEKKSLKALTDISKNSEAENVNTGQDEKETIEKKSLKALTDISKYSKAEHVNTGQDENETIDKRSLKVLTDIGKNSKVEHVNKGQDDNETVEKRSLKALTDIGKNSVEQEGTFDKAPVKLNNRGMSQRRPNSRQGHRAIRYSRSRRERFNSSFGRECSEPTEGKEPHQVNANKAGKDGRGDHHCLPISAGKTAVGRNGSKKDKSLEEDWTDDLMKVNKSVEGDDPNSTEDNKSQKVVETVHCEDSTNPEAAEIHADDQRDGKVDIINNTGPFCPSPRKSFVQGPLQSTPKKKHAGKTFEKCSFGLSDTEVIDNKVEKVNVFEGRPTCKSVKSFIPVNTKLEETDNKTNSTVTETVSFDSYSIKAEAKKIVSRNEMERKASDRNHEKRQERKDENTIGRRKSTPLATGPVNTFKNIHIEHRQDRYGRERRIISKPFRSPFLPETPPRFLRRLGSHRQNESPELNRQRSGPSATCPEPNRQRSGPSATCPEPNRQRSGPSATCPEPNRQRSGPSATCPEPNRQRYGPSATCPEPNRQRYGPSATCPELNRQTSRPRATSRESSVAGSSLNKHIQVAACSADLETASVGWELPSSEDWMSEIEEYPGAIVDSEEDYDLKGNVDNELTEENCTNGKYLVEDPLGSPMANVELKDCEEMVKNVYTDKPYLPPPPPSDEESFNSTVEYQYNMAKGSIDNTATAESKLESLMEISLKIEKNTDINDDFIDNKPVEKDSLASNTAGCSHHQVDIERMEKVQTVGVESREGDKFNIERVEKVDTVGVGLMEGDKFKGRSLTDAVDVNSEVKLAETELLHKAGKLCLDSKFEEQDIGEETDAYAATFSDCDLSGYHDNGMASQENIGIDFTNIQQYDSGVSRLGSLDLSKQSTTRNLNLRKEQRSVGLDGYDGMYERMNPWNDGNDDVYKEWYQRKYFEWYKYCNYYYGHYHRYGYNLPPSESHMDSWENQDYYCPPYVTGRPEMNHPWYDGRRMSDFWQDRMPHWVDSQKETAKPHPAMPCSVGDGDLQDKGENSTKPVGDNVFKEEEEHSLKKEMAKKSDSRVESKSYAFNESDGLESKGPSVEAMEAAKIEVETQAKRKPSGEDGNRFDVPRDRVREEGRCTCQADHVQLLLWRMCRCSEGNPPRLQKIYQGGHEEWSIDLGYQSHEDIDEICMPSYSNGKRFPYLPAAPSTPGPLAHKSSKPWQKEGPKSSFNRSLWSQAGPRPPPGFQPFVYTLTSDNRPAGPGVPPNHQQHISASGDQEDLDNTQKPAVNKPLDNDRRLCVKSDSHSQEENNNAAREQVVRDSDVNNNKLPGNSEVGMAEIAGHVGEQPADDSQYMKLPESLTNSAAHLAEASASLHKAGLTNSNLNSALHTFSEAILAIGKTLRGNEAVGVQQQSANVDSEEVGMKNSSERAKAAESCEKTSGSQGFSSCAGRGISLGLREALIDGTDSSPGCFDTRNVSDRSSVCDADNESDGGWDEVIMEHPMMARPPGPRFDMTTHDEFRGQNSPAHPQQLSAGASIHKVQAGEKRDDVFHSRNLPAHTQQLSSGDRVHNSAGDRVHNLAGDRVNNSAGDRVHNSGSFSLFSPVQTGEKRKDEQEFDQGRVQGPFPRQPFDARGHFIPADFRPRSHFLNSPGMPRYSPVPEQRRAFMRHSFGGEVPQGYRWDPPMNPWAMIDAESQPFRPALPGNFECSKPPGWRINPLSAEKETKRVSRYRDPMQHLEKVVTETVTGNTCASSKKRERDSSVPTVDQTKNKLSPLDKLVDYDSSLDSTDEDEFNSSYGQRSLDHVSESKRTTPAKQEFTPKKLKADPGENYARRSTEEKMAEFPVQKTENSVPRFRRQPLKLTQKVLKSFSTSDVQAHKPQKTPEKRSESHSSKSRTLAEIVSGCVKNKNDYSRSNVSVNEDDNQTHKHSVQQPQELSSLSPMPQPQDLPPLPPLPPFPSSPFWGMYIPPSNSALTGKETQESTYSEIAKLHQEPTNYRGSPSNRQFKKRFTRRSWPISSGLANNYNQSSESDSERSSGHMLEWRRNFRQFHNFGVKYIDTHCHLDFLFSREGFWGNLKDYMAKHPETFPELFEGCVAVFCNPMSFNPNSGLWLEVAKESNVWIAMGCHPKMATDFTEAAERGLRNCLRHSKCVALGEIGLDYSGSFYQHEVTQKRVFRRQLEIALEMQKPLVIHCRSAEEDCLAILKEMVPRDYKIHCHCFTTAYANAQLWLEAFPNLYIGLTPLITYRTATQSHDTAINIPLNRLLLETDAPYFIPRCIPKNDLPLSNPGLAITVAKEVAQLQELPVAAVLRQCRLNTKFMYGI